MRILVVCQHYWPEPFNTSDVCEELVKRGHVVTVLTALPNTGMPGNDIPVEYQSRNVLQEDLNGVHVIRIPLHPRKTGAAHRVANYLSFWNRANRFADSFDEDFDVVLGYQFSPVMQVDPGIHYAKRHQKKMLLYSFDLWPASLTAGGFSEDSLPFKWMKSVSKRIYSQADRIAVTSPLFDKYFREELELDIPDSIYLPQYAEDSFITDNEAQVEGYDPGKVNLTFAGNIGQAQSVITIVEAAALLKDDDRVVFHIVGSGSKLEQCKARAAELRLNNIVFHGRHPIEEMPAYYAASDALIVTFKDSPMARYTLPRKVTTYLAAGKPILAALSGETERVLEEAGCGICCETEDSEGLARIVKEFEGDSNKERMGAAARDYYLRNYTKERFFNTLESELLKLTEERH
jgi:glycosyltransferase involved in cell wall biosynthesis